MATKQELTKLLLDNYRGTGAIATEFSNMSKEEKDDKIRQAFFSVLGTDAVKDEIQLAKLLRAKGNEVFEIIENVITEGMMVTGATHSSNSSLKSIIWIWVTKILSTSRGTTSYMLQKLLVMV